MMQIGYAASDDVLVTGGYDQAIRLWDCRSRSFDPIQTMKSFGDSVTSVAIADRHADPKLALIHYFLWRMGYGALGRSSWAGMGLYVQSQPHAYLLIQTLILGAGTGATKRVSAALPVLVPVVMPTNNSNVGGTAPQPATTA